ncbi:hypothetical protein [uncultured Methanobrevibacter sp.]|uniref:hypothetical protein n=1 Tax=uncultured Methanobrevibacter sp. TaxID=253161 RepID=UPI0025EEFB7F|nr:hypothetical protein [uncultured Methanobrevibacter sp.]
MIGLKNINTENKYDETDEKKLKIADTISVFTNPPIITIPLFLLICIILASSGTPFTSSFNFNWSQFIITEMISLVFASILQMAIILYWAKKLNTDKDISNREDRFIPLIVGVVSYLIGFIISLILGVSNFLTVLILCYAVNTFIVMLITVKWKISIHTTGLTGPVAALIMLLGPIGALFGLLYPILIWSRFTLKKHTMAQAIAGGVFGLVMTVLEAYLYMNLLNLPVYNLVPLNECLWMILAIIITPIILGILTVLNENGNRNTKKIFYILMILVFVFFLLSGHQSALIIFVLTTIVSILVSYFGGENFSWFRAIA